MRHIREVLRLEHEAGAADRVIARALGIARSTVGPTLERVAAAGLDWPLPANLTDRVLEALLYSGRRRRPGGRGKAEPDWACIHHELRRPGVTLMPLWEEYRQREPDGYGYSRWCDLTAPGHVVALFGRLRLNAPIVEDQQLDVAEGAHQPRLTAVTAGQREIADQPKRHRIAVPVARGRPSSL